VKKEMRKIILAIGIITLLIGLSTIPVGANPQPGIVQKAAGDTMTFHFAYVLVAIRNPTEITYDHVVGGKILKNSVYSNVKISGEFWTGGIVSRLSAIFLQKYWMPRDGDQVTVEISRFIGQIKEDTYQGAPYIGLFGGNNGGLGFNIKATIN
jgi:heme A synthase